MKVESPPAADTQVLEPVTEAPSTGAPVTGSLRLIPRFTKGQIAIGLVLALVAAAPIPFGDFGFFVGQYGAVYAMIGLSVVIVTGYAGLISVMPYSFAGIGAMITGVAMASWGWPFWMAVPLAALSTLPISLFVGISSVRLKHLYLAIATLTFANVLGETLFKWERVTGGNAGWLVERPKLGPFDFSGDVAFYMLCLAVVFLLVWMVEGLRTSRTGRAMLAVKDNELEAQAIGINVYKTKLTAFVLSGMVAGIGGAFLAVLLTSVTPTAFQSPSAEATSILLLSLVVIGGIDRSLGAFFGAVSLVVTQQVFAQAECFFAFFGIYSALLLVLFLLFRPGGMIQVGQVLGGVVRAKPAFGIGLIVGLLLVHFAGGYFFVNVC
jgi:branched-chain amino acid transport system permease protein